MSKLVLANNWKIHSGDDGLSGIDVSLTDFKTDAWIEANVPSTVMGVLTGAPGLENILDAEKFHSFDKSVFNKGWWYRTTFTLSENDARSTVQLNFDGISYRADVWVNGQKVASKDEVFGTFRRFSFNISAFVRAGENVLAVEVFRQKEGDFGLGFADWNPRPHDENMGVWREVRIETINHVQLRNPFVQTKLNTETLKEAGLTVSTELENFSNENVSGVLRFKCGEINVERPVALKPRQKLDLIADSSDYQQLLVQKPKIWWCAGMGDPHLYLAEMTFEVNGEIISKEIVRFGIRQIESYFNAQGHRGFKLNGKEVLIKGAGWTDDIFLRDTPQTNRLQVRYVKEMGLNTIRFENIWGTSQNIYDLCDENGLLAMVGWSCQWEWDYYLGKECDDFGGASQKSDYDLLIAYQHDQVKWLRNHPSIFTWVVGSDMLPRPELEKRYVELFRKLDPSRPWLGAASWRESEITGPTGVKMNGPYEYVGPSYWYIDKKYGGAFGFNTETGPGTQIPVKESIERMLPPDKLWPLNEAWDKHCTASADAMNQIAFFAGIVEEMWGKAAGLDDFLMKSHLVNYEAIRPMFEAFRLKHPEATGIIQWMLNSAWPSLYWQLYDYYLVPTPAYYAVKKALEPVQLIFNYGQQAVYVSNESCEKGERYSACIRVYSELSELLLKEKREVSLDEYESQRIFSLPGYKQTVFVELQLFHGNGEKISDNFYWLAPNKEKYNWEATYWAHTPMTQYFDYRNLSKMKYADLEVKTSRQETNEQHQIIIELRNTSDVVSFFNQLKVHNGNGQWIVPSFYSDNYFSIAPKAMKEIVVSVDANTSKALHLNVSGFNINDIDIEL